MVPIRGDTRGHQVVLSTSLILAVTSIFVFVRIYSRAFLLRIWGMEDSLVVFSWLIAFTDTILVCIQTQYGLGHHQHDIPLSALSVSLKLSYISLLLYTIVVCTTKLSIWLLYFRIFRVDQRTKWLIHGCICFLIIYSLAFEIVCLFQCRPIRANWDISASKEGNCINTIPAFYASAACNIVSDLLLMAIVVPRVRELHIRRGQKIALFGIVSLGWLVVVASIVRVVRLSALLQSPDPAWASYDISIWTDVEVNVGIICASAPTIKPLLSRFLPGLMAKLTSQQSLQKYTKYNTSNSFPNISNDVGTEEIGEDLPQIHGG